MRTILTRDEYNSASPRVIERELTTARRLYAAGNYKKAAHHCRQAFLLAQAMRHRETVAFNEKMAAVVAHMEDIHEVTKQVKDKVLP